MEPRATFTRMDHSTRDEWLNIGRATEELQPSVPDAMLEMLGRLESIYAGFGVSQLHHALQAATMARRAAASDELVLAALCHDVGKVISIPNHAAIACRGVCRSRERVEGRVVARRRPAVV